MSQKIIAEIEKPFFKNNIPLFKVGSMLRLHQEIKEGEKKRIQIFEGIVIKESHGSGINKNITLRKIVDGIGVEKIFPLHFPMIVKIELIKSTKVRRAKLYFMRGRIGKKARLKEKQKSVTSKNQNNIDKIQ